MDCCSETSVSVVKDPVYGIQLDPAKAAGQSQYQGLAYSFCSLGFKKKFGLNPVQYMPSDTELPLQAQSVAVPAIAGTSKMAALGKYTCPMHPQIVRDREVVPSAAWPLNCATYRLTRRILNWSA
jgi:YHS domain-containing protein